MAVTTRRGSITLSKSFVCAIAAAAFLAAGTASASDEPKPAVVRTVASKPAKLKTLEPAKPPSAEVQRQSRTRAAFAFFLGLWHGGK